MTNIQNILKYTEITIEHLIRIASSEFINNKEDETKFTKMLLFIKAGKIQEYLKLQGSIGLVKTKEDAIKIVSEYIKESLKKVDKKYSSRGKQFFKSWIYQEIGYISDALAWEGKYEVVAEYLLDIARKIYGWKE
ncbi:MAG: hypothetical protein QXF15_02130 [Candidatus Aenigmatarchaeota archaeon]|nr:hypothetical protein [Candidatus Aenigmarchaeota archaeon]